MPEHGACQPTQPVRHSHASRIAAPAPPSEPHTSATPRGQAKASGCTEWHQARVATHGINIYRSPHHYPKPTLQSEHPLRMHRSQRIASQRIAPQRPRHLSRQNGMGTHASMRRCGEEKTKKNLIFFSPAAAHGGRSRAAPPLPPAASPRPSQARVAAPEYRAPSTQCAWAQAAALLGCWVLHLNIERAPTSL